MIRLFGILVCLGCMLARTDASALSAEDVVWGCDDVGYAEPTDEYDHAVLGDAIEYKALLILVHTSTGILPATLSLPEGKVYEDIAPRCADLDGDGHDEIITVVSDARLGAALTVYSKRSGPVDATPPIGTRYRWLAPAGIADFDGDGQNDVAYVETPHLGGLVWYLPRVSRFEAMKPVGLLISWATPAANSPRLASFAL